MRLERYGIAVDVPRGWDARIFRREGGEPTLHAATYPLPADDGEFGPRAVARMPAGGVFVALTEYRPALAGKGLFARLGLPDLAPRDFAANVVVGGRPGQVGVQRFFTVTGRPFALYVVGAPRDRRLVAATANATLERLEIRPAA